MAVVQKGDRIAIHFRVQDSEGKLIADTRETNAVPLRAGEEDVVPGLSEALVGMTLGEVKALTLAPEVAYGGDDDPALVRTIAKEYLPPETAIGDQLHLMKGEQELTLWVVGEQWGSAWCVSTKHPLAGKTLHMKVKLIGHRPVLSG